MSKVTAALKKIAGFAKDAVVYVAGKARTEPVVTAALVGVFVGAASYVGLNLDPDWVMGILITYGIVAAPVVRSRVTPS